MMRITLRYFTNIPNKLVNAISDESLTQIDIEPIISANKKPVPFDFYDLTVGKFIDIEEFLKMQDLSKAVAIMQAKEEYDLQTISGKHITVSEALSWIQEYNKWKVKVFTDYDDVVSKSSGTSGKTMSWLELVYALADYDPTGEKQEKIFKKKLVSLLLLLRLRKNGQNT